MTPLVEAREEDERFLGGKAFHLGAALRASLPVPDGAALSVDIVDAIARGDSGVVDETRRALLAHFDLARGVAVRSSAVGEDGAQASFAGQHLTVLGVDSIESALEAIVRVHASARAPSALAYRKKMGLSGEPRIAVVVQRMVEPVSAGVLFTRDPTTGDDVRVIECAWGLGEVVVAGLVVPDRYRIARDGKILAREAGLKDLALVRRAGGTEEVPIDPTRARALTLDDARLGRLHDLALRCERAFSGAHDLEFAFDGDDVLHLLQRRAITRIAR